jgi:hypothetical protein
MVCCQEMVKEEVRGRVNGQWRSIIAFFEMSMYMVAMLVNGMRTSFIQNTCN